MSREGFTREHHQDGARCEQPPDAPRLCFNNCGFSGSPATMNLCSKCYDDFVRNEGNKAKDETLAERPTERGSVNPVHESGASKPVVLVLPESSSSTSEEEFSRSICKVVMEAAASVSGSREVSSSSAKTGSSRCLSCRKRVGLLGFKCRCGSIFCSLHRYSDKHACTFDYRTAARDAIARENPVVKALKVAKI